MSGSEQRTRICINCGVREDATQPQALCGMVEDQLLHQFYYWPLRGGICCCSGNDSSRCPIHQTSATSPSTPANPPEENQNEAILPQSVLSVSETAVNVSGLKEMSKVRQVPGEEDTRHFRAIDTSSEMKAHVPAEHVTRAGSTSANFVSDQNDDLCEVAQQNRNLVPIVAELAAEIRENFAIAYSLSEGKYEGLEAMLWGLVHTVQRANFISEAPTQEEFSLMLDMRDAAIQYTKQHPPCVGDSGQSPTLYRRGDVNGMLADFAGHMILEDRRKRGGSKPEPTAPTEEAIKNTLIEFSQFHCWSSQEIRDVETYGRLCAKRAEALLSQSGTPAFDEKLERRAAVEYFKKTTWSPAELDVFVAGWLAGKGGAN